MDLIITYLEKKNLWYLHSENSDGIIDDEGKLHFKKMSEKSVGKYSCYSQPYPHSKILGSSRIQFSIVKYNDKLLKINYDSYESDPYSKSLVAPHILIKSLRNVLARNKTANLTKPKLEKNTIEMFQILVIKLN